MNRDIIIYYVVRRVDVWMCDVWTSLGAKVCVSQNPKCVAGIAKRRKDGQNLVNRECRIFSCHNMYVCHII
jgi:hypothetical protein